MDSIQIVWAIAFIAIFLSHTELTVIRAFGVSVFFILFGFCLVYSYYPRQKNVIGGIRGNIIYAAGKIRKLYPLHILKLLAVAVVTMLSCILFSHWFWALADR